MRTLDNLSPVKDIAAKMNDRLLFLKSFLKNPASIGSITPSSDALGKAIGELVDSLEACSVIEVGAGTGAITKHLLGKNPKLIEIDEDLSHLLAQKFPGLVVRNRCCLEAIRERQSIFGLVVSIPLINNPFRDEFIKELDQAYQSGFLKWCVIYTYGFHNPLDGVSFRTKERKKIVLRNIPPAHVWLYQ